MSKRLRIALNEDDIENRWVEVDTATRPKYSETVSFRLNRRNTREQQALTILEGVKNKREFITNAIVAYEGTDIPSVTIDTDAFAREIAHMRAEFEQRIDALSDTIVAMFETMKNTGVMMDIETPTRPMEKREVANNIMNAFKSRYAGG
ncbi:MAG: hypothetical protein KJ043_11535 [Anaerolineae bacterium]|nr:hypothetical protein [Anaerolineae bacterium]